MIIEADISNVLSYINDLFDWKILKSEDEYEIIEEIRNFNCNGFNFVEFSEENYRVHTYAYIWLCYAIVWGIKKFDEVSQ